MKLFVRGLFGAALCAASSSFAHAQTRLLGIDSTQAGNNLVEFDPVSGAVTQLMPVTGITGAIGSLTRDEAGGVTYLSSSSFDELWTFDHLTGVATLVGPYNVGSAVIMQALEWHPQLGKLYGFSSNSSVGADLFEIDTTTGQALAIGITGITGTNGAGIALANGTMYLASTGSDSLYTVDFATAVTTLIGPFGAGTNIGSGLAYDPALGLFAEDNLGDALYTLDLASGAATLVAAHSPLNVISLVFLGDGVGTPYCPGVANTTGAPGSLTAQGSASVASNSLTVTCADVPANQFGFFVTSMMQGLVMNPSGSQGNLCLGGTIGRYVAPGQIQNAGTSGMFSLALDLTQTPAGPVFVSIAAGETWHFQGWYRDIGPQGQAWSNFTNGLSVTFTN